MNPTIIGVLIGALLLVVIGVGYLLSKVGRYRE